MVDDPANAQDDLGSGAAAPACGLYIILPATDDHNKQNFQLGQALHAANRFSTYDINRHVVEYRPAVAAEKSPQIDHATIAASYAETCRRNGFIFLIYDDVELARACGADGVLCASLKNCSTARKLLPEQAIIGLRTASFEGAKSAISLELDFITLHAGEGISHLDPIIGAAPSADQSGWGRSLLDHLIWWVTATEAAIAIEGDFTPENCQYYAALGATFIDATHHIWTHPSGNFMQGVVNMLDAFEQAKLRQSAHSH
ncbi:MAG: thiamine phosphate synthase [Alphaproteobacteria bacterium]|nr:thiamine phosphate synthase [Alphaproteobacteria bacterium]